MHSSKAGYMLNVGRNVPNRISEGFVKHIQRTASITVIINRSREEDSNLLTKILDR